MEVSVSWLRCFVRTFLLRTRVASPPELARESLKENSQRFFWASAGSNNCRRRERHGSLTRDRQLFADKNGSLRKLPCDTHLQAICNITAGLKIRTFADFRRGRGCWSIKRRDDRRRMRSENFDWFRELGADSHEFNKQVQHLGKGRWLWYPKWLWDKNTAI